MCDRTNELAPRPSDEARGLVLQEITLSVAEAGERLDRYLAGRIGDTSRAEIQRWIREERVSVNGRVAKPSQRLSSGDSVLVCRPPASEAALRPEPVPLDVVYEDADLLVVNKPAGMVVHPAPGHQHGTLVNALLARAPALALVGGPERAGVVHRLDRDTSGLLLVAKTAQAHESLQRQFKTRQVSKLYITLVEGRVPVPAGRVEVPLARDAVKRKRMAVVAESRGGRKAVTQFRVLGHYLARTVAQRTEATLLEVDLLTGRTHQIRVHMAFLHHPVVGDRVYGRRKQRFACPRQFLHASRLIFTHPTSGDTIQVDSPLPPDLQAVLATLAPAT